VSSPRACKMSFSLEESGTNAPKRLLSTMCTSISGYNSKPWQPRQRVSFSDLQCSGECRKVGESSRPLDNFCFVN
jgi:hypothetical protein